MKQFPSGIRHFANNLIATMRHNLILESVDHDIRTDMIKKPKTNTALFEIHRMDGAIQYLVNRENSLIAKAEYK